MVILASVSMGLLIALVLYKRLKKEKTVTLLAEK